MYMILLLLNMFPLRHQQHLHLLWRDYKMRWYGQSDRLTLHYLLWSHNYHSHLMANSYLSRLLESQIWQKMTILFFFKIFTMLTYNWLSIKWMHLHLKYSTVFSVPNVLFLLNFTSRDLCTIITLLVAIWANYSHMVLNHQNCKMTKSVVLLSTVRTGQCIQTASTLSPFFYAMVCQLFVENGVWWLSDVMLPTLLSCLFVKMWQVFFDYCYLLIGNRSLLTTWVLGHAISTLLSTPVGNIVRCFKQVLTVEQC